MTGSRPVAEVEGVGASDAGIDRMAERKPRTGAAARVGEHRVAPAESQRTSTCGRIGIVEARAERSAAAIPTPARAR